MNIISSPNIKPISGQWFVYKTAEYIKPQVSDVFTVYRVSKENNGLKLVNVRGEV